MHMENMDDKGTFLDCDIAGAIPSIISRAGIDSS